MRLLPTVLLLVPALTPLVGLSATPAQPDAEQLFARRILPLFEDKCLACHGREEAKMKAGFDLRTQASMLKGGDSGKPAIIPGQPEKSPLYLAITRESDVWEAMPPKENDRLSDEQISYVRDWIAAGAPWPDVKRVAELTKLPDPWSDKDGVPVPTSGGLSADWTARKYKPENLWAFQPLKKPAVPSGGAASPKRPGIESDSPLGTKAGSESRPYLKGASNPIDAFINERLAQLKLTAAPAADRRTLLRRATFDLTGLPPTPEETAAFLADPAEDAAAFTKVVDRLLASPHYGEKWGQHWLDVVRYADSSGFANDFVRGPAWRYRDYVIRSFNADKPYDRFIREQLAGDELAAEDAAGGEPNPELLIATGFLRSGPWELTGMEVPKVARQKFLDDVTDSVGQAFLAQPLQCARCHDHKFDPIPTRDYYSFQAIFATTQMADRPAKFMPEENTAGFDEKKYLLQRQEHYRAILKRMDEKAFAAARVWFAERKIDPSAFEKMAAEMSGSGKARKRSGSSEAGYMEVRTALLRDGVPEDQVPPKLLGFTPEDFGIERIARKGLERIRWELERYEPFAFSTYSGRTPEVKTVNSPMRMPADRMKTGELEQTCILTGGDPFTPAAKCEPAVLSAVTNLGHMEGGSGKIPAEISGRRRALADWIASPTNPLTARVLANRVWSWHFGQPLAGNPNNFGATGKKPSHPELLDWLAASLVEGANGATPWSLKALHRLIMISDTYRRSAEHPHSDQLAERDPNGVAYAVFKPRRLTAEELRDAMLASSGELNLALGGIPARPLMNLEAALQPRQVMGTFAEAWQPSTKPEQRNRRSIYALKLRGQIDPFMEVFNAPNPELSCEARSASTVTPQALALFNSEASIDRAVALAVRALSEVKWSRGAPAADGQNNAAMAPRPQDMQALARVFELVYQRKPSAAETTLCLAHWAKMTERHKATTLKPAPLPSEVIREAVEENTGEKFKFTEPLEATADYVPDLKLSDVPLETRGLAEVCLVLFNSNEFAFVY